MLVVGSQKYDRHCDTVIISLDTKKRARRIVLDVFASIETSTHASLRETSFYEFGTRGEIKTQKYNSPLVHDENAIIGCSRNFHCHR